MRVAAIDVGTNSTRLLVADEAPEGFRPLDRRMTITRLGQGVDERRLLDAEALERTLRTIADYAAACGEYGVERIRVTGTSAVRDARNRDDFFLGVKKLTGVDAQLLTGEQEAEVTFLGVSSDLPGGDDICVVDIGGGSTELTYGRDVPQRLISLDIGCVRMFEKHLGSDPPTEDELRALRDEVTAELKRARDVVDVQPTRRVVGVAGTVTQLTTLKLGLAAYDPEITHHATLSHGDVRRLARRLSGLTYSQRKRLKAMDPGRADVIVAGAEILVCVLEVLDVAEVLVSEKDMLDGLVLQLLSD